MKQPRLRIPCQSGSATIIYRIIAAAAVLATAAAVPGSTQITYLRPDTAQFRLNAVSQFSPPFQISGTWHLSEQLNSEQGNLTPPLANANLTFNRGPGCSYYASDPCYTAAWSDATGQTNTIVVSVFVSPRGLLLTGYRTAGSYQQSLVSRIANDATQPTRFTLGTWTDADGRTGTFDLAPS